MPGPQIIVEDGTGVANANSYISQANAEIYFQNVGGSKQAAWEGAQPNVQMAALVRGAMGMDFWLNGRWRGRSTFTKYAIPNPPAGMKVQALDWPRQGVRDSDGFMVPNNVVPVKVQQAQCEIAAIELTTPFIQQSVSRNDSIDSQRVGPIDIKYKNTAPSITYWPQIIAMLKDYATIGVMPIEVVIGLSAREMREMNHRHHGGGLNPFDFPDFFHLIKEPIYNASLPPGWFDSWWLI